MATLTIDIGGEALKRLMELAVAERRPADFQAEVIILRSLGCWPYDQSAAREGLLRTLDSTIGVEPVEASSDGS